MSEFLQYPELKKTGNQAIHNTPRMRQNALLFLSVCLLFGLSSSIQAAEPVSVRTQTLSELAIYPESSAPAVVVSLNDAPIAAQVDALVVDVPVRAGDAVKAGAVLAQLGCKDFELDRTRLQAERQTTQARLELAQWELKQTEALAAQQTLPQEQVQQKRSQLAVLRGDLAAHAARIETTTRQIAHCSVKAPFAGVVTARLIGTGQFAARGTPLVRLLDISRSEVSAQVSSRETPALQKAGSLVFEHNGEHYPLRLRTVLPTIHSETGTQEARLDFAGRKAEPGAAGRLLWRDKVMHIAAMLKAILGSIAGVHDIKIDIIAGLPELNVRLDSEAIQRAGLNPESVIRTLQLLADGESVASFIDQDESIGVRVRADEGKERDITAFLRHTLTRPDGSSVPLNQLVIAEQRIGPASINHTDFKRILALQADLDKTKMDTMAVNKLIKERWGKVSDNYPDIKVDFGGEMEAINKSLSQLGQQFVLGIGLIFLIVGAQFRSYGLPFLVLFKVPMAFTGLIMGLLISREPISIFTLYGAVALAGIAVNSAILMFSAAHDRLAAGMGVVHAAVYAARRRMLPILITSLTTLVGLLPLALAGNQSSTMWRPVATAIVWGVGFSTILTLFIVPLLYRLTMGWAMRKKKDSL